MIELEEERKAAQVSRAMTVGIVTDETPSGTVHEHLDELAELLGTLEVKVLERTTVRLKDAGSPKYLIGSGKAEEIAARCRAIGAEVLVFDERLTPAQQRNWSRLVGDGIEVVGREEVILDIFAERASTREAVLQVELARLHYALPRLTRAWTHLSRQHGGGATNRGEGEAQIELDRREIKRRITRLEEELKLVKSQRATQRKERERRAVPHGAIVGYTNAGKSSLLTALSGYEAGAEDKLFATLDPTTKKVTLAPGETVLLTDTVGFIRKLPHELVAAFKSTLEEAVLADFLILVLDLSSPALDDHWDTTLSVLQELGADTRNIVVVFNKLDKNGDPLARQRARGLFPDGLFLSVATGEGMDALRDRLRSIAERSSSVLELKLPPSRYDLKALAHQRARVLDSRYDEEGNILLTIAVAPADREKFLPFVIRRHC